VLAHWLASPAGQDACVAAERVWSDAAGDPLRAGSALRASTALSPAEAAAALEQAALRQQARERHGIDADTGLLLTRDGLEAATRPRVARHRAELVRASGAARVLDLTGGLGLDTAAFLAAGLSVTAVERDPVVAAFLAHNCPAAQVVRADATDPAVLAGLLADLGPADVVFVDPARRDPSAPRDLGTARARPERDPELWSPPWSWVAALPHARIAAKAAPAFAAPDGWQAQWVSVDRTVVECAVYSWPVADADRSAVIVTDDRVAVIAADAIPAAIAPAIGGWLHEVDPAVLRAGALPALAAAEGMQGLGPESSWLTGESPADHPALRSFRVVERLQGSAREQRARLRAVGVSRASIKCRDVRAQPGQVLRDLGLAEGPDAVVILTRLDGTAITVLAERYQARS